MGIAWPKPPRKLAHGLRTVAFTWHASIRSDTKSIDAGPSGVDGPGDVTKDGFECVSPNRTFYNAPGCGVNAVPLCARPQFDACSALVYYCGCDGETTIPGDCTGVSPAPYLHTGRCATDAGTDTD